MRDVQNLIYQHIKQGSDACSLPSQNIKDTSSSLPSTCFKIIYQMLIFSLQTSNTETPPIEGNIFFLFSCLLSCLHNSCFSAHSSNETVSNNVHAVSTMSMCLRYLMDVTSPILLRRSFVIMSDIMKCYVPLLVDLIPLVDGLTADICLRSCLILLQSVSLAIIGFIHKLITFFQNNLFVKVVSINPPVL